MDLITISCLGDIMDNCKVCDKLYTMGKASRNYAYEGFCSRYCYKFHTGNYKITNRTYPQISVHCQTCAKDYNLIKHDAYGNSHFCSVGCRQTMQNMNKRSERDYHYLLPLYQSGRSMTAGEIATSNKYRWYNSKSAVTASYVLNLWHSRGILSRYKDKTHGPYSYQWDSDNPTVKAMLTRQ